MSASKVTSLLTKTSKVATKGKKKSYAQTVNEQYYNQESNIVSLEDRFNDAVGKLNPIEFAAIKHNAIQEFKRINPNVKDWSDLSLAQSASAQAIDLFIDTTLQRELSTAWAFDIVEHFEDFKVVPIHVYVDPETGKMCAWDGQHTAIALYFIAAHILGLDIKDVTFPVVIYNSNKKSQMRMAFLTLNGDGRKKLTPIDYWQQWLYAVRVDGSNNPDWLMIEKKQCILEKYDFFVTEKKLGDHKKPGAIPRTTEIEAASLTALDWICQYLVAVTHNTRAIATKEIVMMAKFFMYCEASKIKVDSNYIKEIARVNLQHFNADFSPKSIFWSKVAMAFANWSKVNGNSLGADKASQEPLHGMPFLVAQYLNDLPHLKMPTQVSSIPFMPVRGDLF